MSLKRVTLNPQVPNRMDLSTVESKLLAGEKASLFFFITRKPRVE